jgi:hypothetical protein
VDGRGGGGKPAAQSLRAAGLGQLQRLVDRADGGLAVTATAAGRQKGDAAEGVGAEQLGVRAGLVGAGQGHREGTPGSLLVTLPVGAQPPDQPGGLHLDDRQPPRPVPPGGVGAQAAHHRQVLLGRSQPLADRQRVGALLLARVVAFQQAHHPLVEVAGRVGQCGQQQVALVGVEPVHDGGDGQGAAEHAHRLERAAPVHPVRLLAQAVRREPIVSAHSRQGRRRAGIQAEQLTHGHAERTGEPPGDLEAVQRVHAALHLADQAVGAFGRGRQLQLAQAGAAA